MEKVINKILVIRNDRFGEFLLIIPALRALKEKFPQAKITLAVDPGVVELAQAIEYADDVIVWENKEHSFKEIFVFSKSIGSCGFDMAVIFNPTGEAHWAVFLARIPVRVGYDRKNGFMLTHKIKDQKHLALKHEVEYNLELVGLVGAVTEKKSIVLRVPDTGVLSGLKGSFVIAVHPWTSDPVKQWPLENFKALIKRLAGFDIVVIGGKEELSKNKDFFNGLHELILNFTGKTSLIELGSILKNVNLLVSGDSGPVHLAVAVGTPVIALFRNDLAGKEPKRWGPWGEGNVIIQKTRLADISVDEVVKKIKEKLQG